MSKKKGNRTKEARRGTKADPERIEAEHKEAIQRQLEREAAVEKLNKRPSWYVEPLDKKRLSDKESVTHYLYILTEIVLFTNIVLYLFILSTDMVEFTLEAFKELFTNDFTYVLDLVGELFQIFGGFIILFCYKRYLVGDAGFVICNLILMILGEVALGNIIGIVCMAVLIWRSWGRCSAGFSVWRSERKFWGKVSDCAPGIIFLLATIMLALARSLA